MSGGPEPLGGGMRTDHLTFLVLAGGLALMAIGFGEVPGLLLPPALPISRPGAPLKRAALRGRRSTPGVKGGPPGRSGRAGGAGAPGKRQSGGAPGNADGDRLSLGGGEHTPATEGTSNPARSQTPQRAATGGTICMMNHAHRHTATAPVVIRPRNDVAPTTPKPRLTRKVKDSKARPDRPRRAKGRT